MESVRSPAVAGRFYSSDRSQLKKDIESYLATAASMPCSDMPRPKALIVPHAGYIYSGSVAAAAYARLAQYSEQLKRIILIGPSHFVRFDGIAAPTCDSFETPLGTVPLNISFIRELTDQSLVQINDQAHASEHSIEVQIPFCRGFAMYFHLCPCW